MEKGKGKSDGVGKVSGVGDSTASSFKIPDPLAAGKSDGVGKVGGVGDSTASSSFKIPDPLAAMTPKKKVQMENGKGKSDFWVSFLLSSVPLILLILICANQKPESDGVAVTPKENVQMEKGKGKTDGVGKVSGVGDSTSSSRNIPDPLAAGTQIKKVLILMSDTGGGHRASAEAITAAFEEKFHDQYEVFVSDVWTNDTPWPFNQLPRSYNFLVKHRTLWSLAFYASVPRAAHEFSFAATSTFIARKVAEGLMQYKPDIIISVHPLMQHVPLASLRSEGLLDNIVFTTVVTDLSTCHPTWFHNGVARCYCPSKEVEKRALDAGLEPSKIKVYGLPVRPSFHKPDQPMVQLRRRLRSELNMDENLRAVLLMGGGEGMGPIESTARALGDALYDENLGEAIGQVLVICGRNKKLANKLLSINWEEKKVLVKVEEYVTNMEKYMGACDCIITKAGPGTIAEALTQGLPIILNDFIVGQETGNVPYVVENGCGIFSKSPKEIAETVRDWFGPKAEEFNAMSQKALDLARPDAAFEIVNDLHEFVSRGNDENE